MKYSLACIILIFLTVGFNTKNSNIEVAMTLQDEPTVLPFTKIHLNDLSAFKSPSKNWRLVSNVNVDRTKKGSFISEKGTGVLLNSPKKGKKGHLFTTFEHGDIELELDVMMPVASNSGLYFQGRYEVQLLDSWGVDEPQHSDIGGIYQRWDDSREKKGYEGIPPTVNAAKAPGLWQHFKIIFQAPKFDASGNKIKNAMFKEVWLNGALLHKNQEVTGPTRSSAFNDEKVLGPLMIQGDHGAVAFRDIRYKLYESKKITLSNISLKEYQNKFEKFPNLEALEVEREEKVETLSSSMVTGERPQKLLVFKGTMNIPKTGDYLFDLSFDGGGGALLINKDTVVSLNGAFDFNKPKFGRIKLEKGTVPFTFIYNKHRHNRRGFGLSVEGPNIAKHNLHALGSIRNRNDKSGNVIEIEVTNETLMQRGFLMHEGLKRTHCISVGTEVGINYSYDLSNGSLLQVWGGDFLDVTKMWYGRGGEQLGVPIGVPVSSHGDQDFSFLENEASKWPENKPEDTSLKQMGYELDANGIPKFEMQLDQAMITNLFLPIEGNRSLKRNITTNSDKDLYHKIAEGVAIEKLSNNSYAIDDKNYFVEFSSDHKMKLLLRNVSGKDELLIKIPAGTQAFSYTIIW